MATLTPTFHEDAKHLHGDHLALGAAIDHLDAALDRLICFSEVYANLAAAGEVYRCGRELNAKFPRHCRREEAELLAPVSAVSPDLCELCGGLAREHQEVLARLAAFTAALDEYERAADLDQAVRHVKETGKDLTHELRRHIAIEEHELSGFL